jgi:hypothetical protein
MFHGDMPLDHRLTHLNVFIGLGDQDNPALPVR